MKIIGLTNNGALIEASFDEVKSIHRAVTGQDKEIKDIKVGDKLPAIDYATTITKIKTLKANSKFTYLESYLNDFNQVFEHLKTAVHSASDIDSDL